MGNPLKPLPPALLEGLNPQQAEGVSYRGSALLIAAGAGSGKTRVLTHRIAGLIATGEAVPSQILAITFTNKAAAEMRHRAGRLLGKNVRDMQIATFHSTCVRVLREQAEQIGRQKSFSIYDQADQKAIIKRICQGMRDTAGLTPGTIASRISALKNELHDPESYARMVESERDQVILEVFREYQDILQRANAFDFDDLIAETVHMFRSFPDIARQYRRRWRHLLVDEYQDTNRAQYELILELTRDDEDNQVYLTAVGDSDQSIYAFRGADITNILNFEKDFPQCRVILLEQNYRSCQNILSAANALISNNPSRKDKNLWSDLGEGEKIIAYAASSVEEEARFVIDRLLALRDRGESLQDMAIFYRSNTQSRSLEEALVRRGVPYRIIGGTKFYERAEIKDVLAYLTVIANPYDELALRRILNVPKRGVGATSEGRLLSFAADNHISLRDALGLVDAVDIPPGAKSALGGLTELLDSLTEQLPHSTPHQLLQELLEKTDLLRRFENSPDPQDEARKDNMYDFISSVHDFTQENPESTLVDFLANVALVSPTDDLAEHASQVTLMTLHMAKGLEFDFVFLTGLEDGLLPHEMAMRDIGGVEEERRLAYVGFTRARKLLHLSYSYFRTRFGLGRSYSGECLPSRFWEEIPADLLNWHSEPRDWRKNSGALFQSNFAESSIPKAVKAPPRPLGEQLVTAASLRDNGDLQLAPGDRISHTDFGEGTVISLSGEGPKQIAAVNFGDRQRKLVVKIAPITKISSS